MSRSLQEYHELWQQTMQGWNIGEIVDKDLTNESCVIFDSGGSSPMDEGMLPFPDFGDAICYYRYYRYSEKLESYQPQEQNGEQRWPKLTNNQLPEHFVTAIQALDDLLEEFVQQGYRSEMSKRLQEIVNHPLVAFHLFEVYVLPGDLDTLLNSVSNPLVDYDAFEAEEEAEAHAPVFDLNNPEHREALKESIFMVGR